MTAKLSENKWHLNVDEGFLCRFIDSKTEREVLHTHEFFEIFLNQTNKLAHHINGRTVELKAGELVFIRPYDEHYCTHNQPYSFINLAFSQDLAHSLFRYLGNEFPSKLLLESKTCPSVTLSDCERRNVENMLQTLNIIAPDKTRQKRIQCKIILAEIFGNYFIDYSQETSDDRPELFVDVCNQMHNKDNFKEGADAMVRISNKTYAHLCRCIKKYYNKTMSEYINDIRLNYAVNLLIQTNMSITDIAYECGFSSQNWFNSRFKQKYKTSPHAMRTNPDRKLL